MGRGSVGGLGETELGDGRKFTLLLSRGAERTKRELPSSIADRKGSTKGQRAKRLQKGLRSMCLTAKTRKARHGRSEFGHNQGNLGGM